MNGTRHSMIVRTLLAAVSIALLVHLAERRDALSDFSRPLVAGALHLMGVDANDEGETIRVGRLSVPWTRDCAGVNLLLIMLALGVWMNRLEPVGRRFWIRIGALVPAALLANVARVLTLVAYRQAMYPAVENPQLHYFMGLVWLVPFVTLIAPRHEHGRLHLIMEGLYAAAVVALLAPMSGTPHGEIVIAATVLTLMHCRVRHDRTGLRQWLMLPWLAAGVVIGLCGMESCWLPWLLVCPLLLDASWFLDPVAWGVVASSNAMLLLLPGVEWISMACVGWMGWRWWNVQARAETTASIRSKPYRIVVAGGVLAFAIPFIASTLLALGFEHTAPPADLVVAPLGTEGYELRLPDQPASVGLVWYGATSTDRHHTVKVCMKYRGADLESVAEAPNVFTDGSQWIREFFLQDHRLHDDYAAYLRSTFKLFASPGTHIIFVTTKSETTPAAFDRQCQTLAKKLAAHCFTPPPPLIERQL